MEISQFKRVAIAAGALLAVLAGVGGAHAATLQWRITNNFGSAINLERSSCSNGTYVSAPYSISSGSTITVSATTSGTTDLCNLRYQSSNGVQGCQFQVQASPNGAFASANAYKGSGGSPNCPYGDNSSPGAGSGIFQFNP